MQAPLIKPYQTKPFATGPPLRSADTHPHFSAAGGLIMLMRHEYPTFDHLKVHHDPDGSDARDPVVIELVGPCHMVKLVLPDGQSFFKRLVDICLGAIPPTVTGLREAMPIPEELTPKDFMPKS